MLTFFYFPMLFLFHFENFDCFFQFLPCLKCHFFFSFPSLFYCLFACLLTPPSLADIWSFQHLWSLGSSSQTEIKLWRWALELDFMLTSRFILPCDPCLLYFFSDSEWQESGVEITLCKKRMLSERLRSWPRCTTARRPAKSEDIADASIYADLGRILTATEKESAEQWMAASIQLFLFPFLFQFFFWGGWLKKTTKYQ